MEGEDKLDSGELESVVDSNGDIIRHGRSGFKAGGGAISRGDGDPTDAAIGEGAIGGREGAANGGTKATAREEGLEGEQKNQGGNGVALAHTISQGDGRAEIAIDLDACGSTCKEHLEGRDEGRGPTWGIHIPHIPHGLRRSRIPYFIWSVARRLG